MPIDPRSKTAKFNFGLNGLITKESATQLTDGQYRSTSNMEVVQEGSLSTRAGKKSLGTMGGGTFECYMIQKMVVVPGENPSTPSTNPRYLGIVEADYNIYRTLDYTSFTKVASSVNTSGLYRQKAFQLATYSAGTVGGPWAFIASELKMLKDRGAAFQPGGPSPYGTLLNWGILPAFGTATGVASGGSLMDGGDPASPNGSTAYDYRYCNVATDTNNQGNPSETMLDSSDVVNGTPVAVHLQGISVTGYGTGDPQVGSIKVYRRGGLLFDAWRLVQQVTNPGSGATWNFVDTIPDADLEFAPLLEFDNDPPVTSTVPTPITGSLSAIAAAGRQTVNLTIGTLAGVTAGTTLHIFYDNPEDVIVEQVLSSSSFIAYFQRTHSANADFEIDAITNQPCNLAISYQQFVLVAGDPNNPHLIYRSKGDMPEAFSTAPADGTVSSVACGTPANPIMNLYQYRGQILTLNLYGIFETLIFQGSLVTPAQMASKGTVGRRANCEHDTEIWFLANDGVWSWDGATCRKRSEAIDPIFHGQAINGFYPLDYDQPDSCVMTSRRGQVYLSYLDFQAVRREIICEPSFNDRWRDYAAQSPSIPFIFAEPDTNSMIEERATPNVSFSIADLYQISGGINYTADYFTSSWSPPSATNGGSGVPFDLRLPWFDMGSPASQKSFEEVLLELDTTGSVNGTASLSFDILYDFSDTPGDTLTVTVPVAGGRTVISLLPQLASISSNLQSRAKEARAISYHISGSAWPVQMSFYSITLVYTDTDILTAGGSGEWTDLGYPHDKKLYQMVVTFDVEGINQTIVMDTIKGIDGNIYTPAAQSFVLSNPIITGGGGRAKKTFPVADGTIIKMVRVRPYSSASAAGQAATNLFRIFSVEFPEKEDYPPDIVSYTPREDGGYAYSKYLNQCTLEVDTAGIAVAFQIQADGLTLVTETVTATESDRIRNITIPANLSGFQWRIFVDTTQSAIATGGGKFQLFNAGKIFRFQPADRGEVGHTFDWDDLGHLWDKYLKSVTIEWDNDSFSSVTMSMDTLTGINGNVVTAGVASFVLSGARSKREFPLPKDTIAKMIRIYPLSVPNVRFRQWKYNVDKIDYPCDIVLSTDWRNAENPNDKNPSWLSIDADTNNVPCLVNLQNEIGTVISVLHTGTVTNRMKDYPIPPDIFAKMWRLLTTPGTNGKFQMWSWGFERWQPIPQTSPSDPPDIVFWTPWSDWGWPYGSIGRNLILTIDTGGISCGIQLQTENGTVQTFTVNTTYTTRRVVLPCNFNLIGLMWRLLLSPGTGGKAKLWDWSMDVVKEPAAVTEWSSYQQGFGYRGFKIIRQIWLEYQCNSALPFTITSDTGTYVINFPPHATRAVERFLLPSAFGSGLNKSKLYSFSWTSASPAKVYSDVSGVEWLGQGTEQHAGYNQTLLSEFMTLAI